MPPTPRRSARKPRGNMPIPPHDHRDKTASDLYFDGFTSNMRTNDPIPASWKLGVAEVVCQNNYVRDQSHALWVSTTVEDIRRTKLYSEPVARLLVTAYLVLRADVSHLDPVGVARMERLLKAIPAAFEVHGFPGYTMIGAQDELDRIMRPGLDDGAPGSDEHAFVVGLSYVERAKHWLAKENKRKEESAARNAAALQQAQEEWAAFNYTPTSPVPCSDSDSDATVPLEEEEEEKASETDYTDPEYVSDADSEELPFNIHLNDASEMVSVCV